MELPQGLGKYRFEFKHLIVLVLVLVLFQFGVLYLNQRSMERAFVQSQEWYQRDAAERIANLTTTSLELLLESTAGATRLSEPAQQKFIQDANIIFSQQLLEKDVRSVCILLFQEPNIVVVDDGQKLFEFVSGTIRHTESPRQDAEALHLFQQVRDQLASTEQTISFIDSAQVFHVFVPFVPRGELIGTVYMQSTPDLEFLRREMEEEYRATTIVYSLLIIFGLVTMFIISSRTIAQRNAAQLQLFDEQKKFLAEQIHHQKEMMFTKRIYHTHHKAEKIGGFIKEDLRRMTTSNLETLRGRIDKYVSFIARVIYDMKWYDPPLQTIRGPLFRTDVNTLLTFLVNNVFQRATNGQASAINLVLGDGIPPVCVNEYVVWEAIEPIIQNALDHSGVDHVVVTIATRRLGKEGPIAITISDNGKGISPELLERNAAGIQRLFLEHVTSQKDSRVQHSGYGCYIAHELATQRLGWALHAENLPSGGCAFTFGIPVEHIERRPV